tara:strand:+ start:244 stop:639 length:396 start_codon:yes stop_codon:yes gene_type:complete
MGSTYTTANISDITAINTPDNSTDISADNTKNVVYPSSIEEWPHIKVYGTDFRPMLQEMADTISRLELWDWFRNEDPPGGSGFMYWGHKNVSLISNNLPNNEHSGATFGYAMRCMQSIAKNGFDEWKNSQQ